MVDFAALQNITQYDKLMKPDGTATEFFMRLLQARSGASKTIEEQIEILQASVLGKADKTTQIIAGAVLTGGGDLSADRTIDHETSLVSPGTYGDATNVPQIIVDEYGHIQSVVDVPITGGGGGGGGGAPSYYNEATTGSVNFLNNPPASTIVQPVTVTVPADTSVRVFAVLGFYLSNSAFGTNPALQFVQDNTTFVGPSQRMVPLIDGNYGFGAMGSVCGYVSIPGDNLPHTIGLGCAQYGGGGGFTVTTARAQIVLIPLSGGGGGGGGGGGETLLATYTCAGGEPQIDLPGIPAGYGHLIVRTALQGSTGDSTRMRFNGDTSAIYDSYRMFGGAAGGNDQDQGQNSFRQNIALSSNFGGTAPGFFASSEIHIPFYDNSSRFKTYTVENSWANNGGALSSGFVVSGAGKWRSTAAINQITLFPITGTFNAGSVVEVWGVKGSGGGGGGGEWWFDPPPAASFTTAFGGAHGWATFADDADAGLTLDAGAPYTGDASIYAYQAIPNPAGDWQATIKMNMLMPSLNYSSAGILCQNSANSRIDTLYWEQARQVIQFQLNPGSYNAQPYAQGYASTIEWLRIKKVGTNLEFWISTNGKTWSRVYTKAIAAWLGANPDRIGFGVLYNRAGGPPATGSVEYWEFV